MTHPEGCATRVLRCDYPRCVREGVEYIKHIRDNPHPQLLGAFEEIEACAAVEGRGIFGRLWLFFCHQAWLISFLILFNHPFEDKRVPPGNGCLLGATRVWVSATNESSKFVGDGSTLFPDICRDFGYRFNCDLDILLGVAKTRR